jgi:hypothetical protein
MLDFDPDYEGAFPCRQVTEAIGAAFEVHNELGYGFLHAFINMRCRSSSRVVTIEQIWRSGSTFVIKK